MGYYDRFLNEYQKRHGGRMPKTIGLALLMQMHEDLPMDEWDKKVIEIGNEIGESKK